jgi:hypothetical protein
MEQRKWRGTSTTTPRNSQANIKMRVSFSDRAPAATRIYHELDLETLEKREGVHQIRDAPTESWDDRVAVLLAPDRDCKLTDLTYDTIDRLEQQRGERIEWAAYAHRDTDKPHVHVIIKDPTNGTQVERQKFAEQVQNAAAKSYELIRERQRAYAKAQDHDNGRSR